MKIATILKRKRKEVIIMLKKTIEKQVRYIKKIDISEPDRDKKETICYFKLIQENSNENFFGWKEYDYRINQPMKSDTWNFRDKMWVSFVPKPEEILNYGQPITIIQRLKKI